MLFRVSDARVVAEVDAERLRRGGDLAAVHATAAFHHQEEKDDLAMTATRETDVTHVLAILGPLVVFIAAFELEDFLVVERAPQHRSEGARGCTRIEDTHSYVGNVDAILRRKCSHESLPWLGLLFSHLHHDVISCGAHLVNIFVVAMC